MSFLRKTREKMGLTQTELGERIGVSQSTIGRLEAGTMDMTREYSIRLADVTGISPVFFVFPDDEYRDDVERVEMVHDLLSMKPEDRRTAIAVIRPFIDAHKPNKA
jgi:transcriptional regulator with XRE-family HTH domain